MPAHLVEGVMSIEHGQDKGFDSTATGQDMGGMGGIIVSIS
jgi:hypothetical protein